MKGRTGISVLRAVEEWHGELSRERKINGHTYAPSGLLPLMHERKMRLPSGAHHVEKIAILEIATSKELAQEGRALRHCVYSYSWQIQHGGRRTSRREHAPQRAPDRRRGPSGQPARWCSRSPEPGRFRARGARRSRRRRAGGDVGRPRRPRLPGSVGRRLPGVGAEVESPDDAA